MFYLPVILSQSFMKYIVFHLCLCTVKYQFSVGCQVFISIYGDRCSAYIFADLIDSSSFFNVTYCFKSVVIININLHIK